MLRIFTFCTEFSTTHFLKVSTATLHVPILNYKDYQWKDWCFGKWKCRCISFRWCFKHHSAI